MIRTFSSAPQKFKALTPYPDVQGSIRRDATLQAIERSLDIASVAVLTGLPGVGKTTCAAQFVDQCLGNQFDYVLWVDGREHAFKLVERLAKLLSNFGNNLPIPVIGYENGEQNYSNLLFDLSKMIGGRVLFVFDHFVLSSSTAHMLHSVRAAVPWKMLVVSVCPDGLDGYPEVALPMLTVEESTHLFRSRYKKAIGMDANALSRLCVLLEGHPLAIGLYADLLSANPGLQVSQLMDHLETRQITPEFITGIDTVYDKVGQENRECSVIRVLQCAFLADGGWPALALNVLKLFSLLPDDAYTFEDIRRFAIPADQYTFLLAEALRHLSRRGLVIRASDSYRCPELIKRVVYLTYWVDAPDVQNTIDFMVSAIEHESSAPMPEKLRYLAICEYLLRFTVAQNASMANLYHALNDLYDAVGNHPKAIIFAEKELKIRSSLLQADEARLADTWNRLGASYLYESAFELSWEYLSKALEARTRLHGRRHYLTGRTLMNLGALYVSTANFGAGHACLKTATSILKKDRRNPTRHKDAVTVTSLTGDAFRVQGDFGQAEVYYRRALRMLERATTGDRTDLHLCYEKMALCRLQGGQAVAAEPWAEKALVLKKTLFGETHRFVGDGHYLLAVVQKMNGRKADADAHFEQFARIYRVCGLKGSPEYANRKKEFSGLKNNIVNRRVPVSP
ncbi:MAG: tetratricopeptide repeat protein [Saprospiraceae bacterium]|nr:tetratricopeptide repeat protein [Saprospiraceae bacterium]